MWSSTFAVDVALVSKTTFPLAMTVSTLSKPKDVKSLRRWSIFTTWPPTLIALRNAIRRGMSQTLRADQIPPVAVQVLEHRDRAVALGARRLGEPDPRPRHPVVLRREIVGLQEERHAAPRLVAHSGLLGIAVRLRQQQARASVGRTDDDPSLLGGEGSVLVHDEPERADEPADRFVVVMDHERHSAEANHGLILPAHAKIGRCSSISGTHRSTK